MTASGGTGPGCGEHENSPTVRPSRAVAPKVGVYVPAHNNPYFLRHVVLQILVQTRPPDLLVIHQNNHPEDYSWVIEDLAPECQRRCMEVQSIFNPISQPMQHWDAVGLSRCLECGCAYIFKFDHDDLYRVDHIETLLACLESGFAFVANRYAGWLVLKKSAPFEYIPDLDFAGFNPLQCMSSSMAFNREFGMAIQGMVEMLGDQPWEIDSLIRDFLTPRFAGRMHRIDTATPSSTYVCYGGNVSTAHWFPQEQHLVQPSKDVASPEHAMDAGTGISHRSTGR